MGDSTAKNKKPNEVPCVKKHKKRISADNKMIYTIVFCLGVSLLVALITWLITLTLVPVEKRSISAGLLRDVNVMFISVNATLIGLYVTGFIFLNDSLKTRVKEDPTLRNAVSDIMETYRKIMNIVAVSTVAAIIVCVANNIFVGETVPELDGAKDYQNAFLSFSNVCWLIFLFSSFFSACIMGIIIHCSSQITNSDRLIFAQSSRECRKYYYREIKPSLQKHEADYSELKTPELKWEEGEYTDKELAKYLFKEICKELQPLDEMGNLKPNRGYNFASIYHTVKEEHAVKDVDNGTPAIDEGAKSVDDKRIRFSKLVRAIELIVSKICDNNIDKSIQGNDSFYENVEEGFIWLYVKGHVKSKNIIDVRDENRFFDYVKYKILNTENLRGQPFANAEAERIFKYVKDEYYQCGGFGKKKEIIENYKQSMQKLIEDFFQGYKQVISFRNAIEHYYAAAKEKNGNNMWGRLDEALTDAIPYAETLKRVLIDRFTSFVKTDDINLGNTMMPEAWFNYSELSKSNFTHSSFEGAHIENAIVKDCDLSISSLIRVDASDTDFSNSNFNFSNLTGIDLSHATLDDAQLNSVLLRDGKMDDLNGWEDCLFHKEPKYYVAASEKAKFFKEEEHAKCRAILEAKDNWKNNPDNNKASVAETTAELVKVMRPPMGAKTAQQTNAFSQLWMKKDTKILSCEESGDNLLQTTYEAVKESLQGVLDAHKYGKINQYLFDRLKDALKYESAWNRKEGEKEQPAKEHRIETYGKINFETAILDAASIEDVSMRRIDFSYVSMENTSFKNSDLTGAEMYYTKAKSAEFGDSKLSALDAYGADFSECGFHQAKLINSLFLDCNVSNANFAQAVMLRTALIASRDEVSEEDVDKPYLLRFVKEEQAHQRNLHMQAYERVDDHEVVNGGSRSVTDIENLTDKRGLCVDSNFTEVLASEIFMLNINANRALFKKAVLKQGVFYNCLVRWSCFDEADISNGIFIGDSFHQTSFARSSLARAAFCSCEFSNADLSGADLISCRMKNVILEEAKLNGCNFAGAMIEGGIFRSCAMYKINITGATFNNVTFVDVDFSEAIGLSGATFNNCTFVREIDRADSEINLREAPDKQIVMAIRDEIASERNKGQTAPTYSFESTKKI